MKATILGLLAVILSAVSGRAAVDQAAIPPAGEPQAGSPERFDDLVRDDFFAGMGGDRPAFDEAMKLCRETLARKPGYAPAMVWQGTGLLFLSGQAFRTGDAPKGMDLWRRGLKEMNDAVALQPENIQVLIPRAATFLRVSKYLPDETQARDLIQTGVADYEKVLGLQKSSFVHLSVHARGELLSALADGWFRLGNRDQAQLYLRRIIQDLPGSVYAVRASDLLRTSDLLAWRNKFRVMSCIGCHGE